MRFAGGFTSEDAAELRSFVDAASFSKVDEADWKCTQRKGNNKGQPKMEMRKQIWSAAVVALLCHAFAFEAFAAPVERNSIEVASGLVTRRLDVRGGRLIGQSYKTADGTEFMQNGAPEFAFRTKGRPYTGHLKWKDVSARTSEMPDGVRTVTVTAISADGVAGIEMSYTPYPGRR